MRPVPVPELRTIVEGLGADPAGCRDRALLLLGFAGALRRSELVGLDLADVTDGANGLTVHLRRSKTDQEGAGRTIGIPFGSNLVTCSVRAWRAWLEVSDITEGPAFRPVDRHGHIGSTRLSAPAVALVLKRHAARAGLDPGEVAGHSLRAGLATSAAAAGVPDASLPSRPATRARRCFAGISARDRCSVRMPPARLGCRTQPGYWREPTRRPGRCWPRGPEDDEALRPSKAQLGPAPDLRAGGKSSRKRSAAERRGSRPSSTN